MERHDIQPDWENPENNGGFGGKPVTAPATPATDEPATDEPKEKENERPAKPKR
jgi:hypothetical protein